MYPVEYDSDYIHSGDEDTKRVEKSNREKKLKMPEIQRQIKDGVDNILRPSGRSSSTNKESQRLKESMS